MRTASILPPSTRGRAHPAIRRRVPRHPRRLVHGRRAGSVARGGWRRPRRGVQRRRCGGGTTPRARRADNADSRRFHPLGPASGRPCAGGYQAGQTLPARSTRHPGSVASADATLISGRGCVDSPLPPRPRGVCSHFVASSSTMNAAIPRPYSSGSNRLDHESRGLLRRGQC